MNENKIMGNTIGNLQNKGLVAGEGEWLYFVLEDGLYRSLKNGDKKIKIASVKAQGVHILGQWIFYIEEEKMICKLKVDGSEKVTLVESEYNDIYNLMIFNKWIYYTLGISEAIYRIDFDGDNKQFLFGKVLLSIAMDGEYILYSDDQMGYIIRVSINRIEKFLALSETELVKEWVKYHKCPESAIEEMKRYGISKCIDTEVLSEGMLVSEDQDCFSINIVNEWIYYLKTEEALRSYDNPRDIKCHIYKSNIEGGKSTKLSNEYVRQINVSGHWIYYINYYNGNLYRMDINGECKMKLSNDWVTNVYLIDNWVYYYTKDKINKNLFGICLENMKTIQID